MEEIRSEWESAHTVGSISISADPISTLETSFKEIIISGWDEIDEDELKRINRYPVAFVFVTEVSPEEALPFQQDTVAGDLYAAAIRIIDRGADRSILEKKLYRYTHAVFWMMLADTWFSQSGWYVANVSKAYSGIVPIEPLMKAGQVSFLVTIPEVVD